MWPYIRSEIKKTYVDPHLFATILQVHPQKNYEHEIGYTSLDLPKRIELGDAMETNAYHFFFYMIARFYYFDDLSGDIHYYFPNKNNNYLPERALSLLPPRFKRELVKTPGFEYIEMPGCYWYDDSINEPWIYSYVRDLFKEIWKDTPREKGKYTYISRNKRELRVRRCLNEDQLIPPLKDIGFSVYTMEHMTFEQQVRLFRSSEVITGVHGAGFAWLIFCHPGTIVCELYKPIPKRHYEDISTKCNLRYYKFQAVHEPNPNEFTDIGIDDCVIDKEAYLNALQHILKINN